ncbi:exonuclease RecB [Sinorhizobium fredii USDA 205]|uniref:Double-strand break repair protein AddB n=1 Tax=Rhizobium fredii TaxID=380 RepID=A0A844AEZ6_RHIFR|nr:double-strand break repair protein AddB [Sinorhizobium fredii]AWM27051.1 ATP-dependent nuclease subunit B [Sinorhizobium fredii CCBAU 25509]KSV87016.1 exonuclease RecB [Sinorhizobium fredii USDA 205]MCG5475045.1 double-strand break repair protein AddB [Sinorhizobium fredii]MQW96177.1 double-strand break repair protein AddB [Sinorhizobium fredii]MQX11533.1 double-strand break repair protein AddB [Sinorhizobium fredii]
MPGHASNVFTIPAGLPFLKTLAEKLVSGVLTPDFQYDPADPLALAGVTIFVPTRRAARVLRSEFVDLLGGRSAILPVIRPLGETDDDSGFFDAEVPAILDLAPPLSGTARLIELGRLILAWRNRLPQVVLDIHAESPLIAPASPADAIWLARNLAELIDAIETEELDWDALDGLDAGEHALWWQLTLAFVKIARTYWPERLNELKHSSPARHRNAMLKAETQRIAAGKVSGPIIIAGSTGSIPATAALIAAVKALPNGTIVLPGLDLMMSEAEWELIAEVPASGPAARGPASRTHPQYGFHRLLKRMRIERRDVPVLGSLDDDLGYRGAVLSRALLPAEATDGWTEARDGFEPEKLLAAFADVALIEAANEREEATAIAIALRLALEGDEDSQAALITPDRGLARRVGAELARFGIEADDSAGVPLSATAAGALARLLIEATLRPDDPVALVALLKHPLARFGQTAEDARRAADVLELLALRGGTDLSDISALETVLDKALARQSTERHPRPWRGGIDPDGIGLARALARRISTAVEPLTSTIAGGSEGGRHHSMVLTLADWAERTGRALEAVAIDERGSLGGLWGSEAGETLATLLRGIIETDGQMEADGRQWCDIVEALAASEAVKPRSMRHPRVFIFGALESRLQSVDLVVLGGMNEGTWPGQTSNDPFLSRTMKSGIGLEPPERRIGQLAHDFQMACGTRRLILSRSMRQGSAPTVASRWLQRLQALGGKTLTERLKANGADYLHWMRILDEGERQPLSERPQPKPPAELQPRKYSFSEVTRLRRDPYAIYARRILRLEPIDSFNRDPGAAERGLLYHRIVDRFVKGGFDPASRDGEEAMVWLIREAFDEEKLPAHIDTIWRPRFEAVARTFLSWEQERRHGIVRSFTEVPAGMDIGVADIRLTGIADRLDRLTDGTVDIIDYKTGSSPSAREARALLDPQLALEAAALKAGAFGAIGPARPHALHYVRLKPGSRFVVDTVNNENSKSKETKSADQLAEESFAELRKLLAALTSGKYGFASRLIVQKERDYGGEYDHLARVAEWATADGEDDDEE